MAMDWGDLAKSTGSIVGQLLLQNAPTIGSLLGGMIPLPGGSLIGQEVGQILADQFGTANDPTSIANAINASPADIAAAKIQAAEAEVVAKWPAIADIAKAQFQANASESESINATMRAELAAGQKWYSWRNLYGYSVGIEASATSFVILYSLVFNPTIFQNVSNSLSFFLSWYTLRFGLLGYIHNQATNEKIAAVTGTPPAGIVKSIVQAVKKK